MEQYLPLILSAVSGLVMGPLASKLTGGSSIGGIIGGLLGGVGTYYGLEAANVHLFGVPAQGPTALKNILNYVMEGGVGGGVVGVIVGMLVKHKA
ncbi:hypothetical protein [Hyphomonas oceanitis]|uniref:Uncharacterized protein n=1 Tax=Hyphomonas oceanitis SCH89 TaxID=1280953 RepID=A0A059GBS2_9PROT|nr:hypothetical protein [Hyphomonas oceanitis]KDA04015.1 hypothetical protein HOC_01716 [Hyphomonas oceanitis SCH89]